MEHVQEVRHTKVPIPPQMPVKEIMAKYNVKEGTAYGARKRGYLIENSLTPEIIIDREAFNVNQAYKIALRVFWKSFAWKYKMAKELQEDLIQEAVTRQFELSGKKSSAEKGKYNEHYQKYWIAHNAMLSYIMKHIRRDRNVVSIEDLYIRNNTESDRSSILSSDDAEYGAEEDFENSDMEVELEAA